jgi:TolB-like protein/tetratricopeptide (TPR) repeat protein
MSIEGDRSDRGVHDMTDSDLTPGSGVAPTTVFFSYSRDDQARALPIIRLIEQAGFAVWWDGLLEGGERFSRATEDALDRAQAVVVLWSKTSVNSHWVHDEATRGRDRGVLVPLSLDGTQPPLGFGQFQVIDLAGAKVNGKDAAIQRMIHAVAVLHGDSTTPIVPRPVVTAPGISRRAAIVGGSAAAGIAGGFAVWQTGLLGGGTGGNRIAVMPFANLGGVASQAYLADGLCAEIRSMLAQNGALQVVGQASSEAFSDSKLDSIAIAKKLKADFLVDGAVQVAGGVIRITSELIEGKSGINRLPQSFEKPMEDVLSVQREIAGAISAKLTSKIAAGDPSKVALGGTANVTAFDHYLRGKDLYAHAKDEAEEREAITHFDAAIAADPKFASAHTGRAKSLAAVAGQYGSVAEIKQYFDSAIVSVRRAIELAPKLADAHSTFGLMLFQGELNMKAARAPFQFSRQLGEGEAPVLARFAVFCAATGRDREAMAAIERAVLLDPLNALIHRILGTVHFAARRYPETIGAVRETIKLNPDLQDTHCRIGMAQLAQNRNAEALKAFEAEKQNVAKQAGIAISQQRLGNDSAAKAAMAELTSETETVSLFQQGQVLAQWGDLDAAVATLEQAYEQRDGGMTTVFYDPMLDPLRKLPRFIRLLKSLGFD